MSYSAPSAVPTSKTAESAHPPPSRNRKANPRNICATLAGAPTLGNRDFPPELALSLTTSADFQNFQRGHGTPCSVPATFLLRSTVCKRLTSGFFLVASDSFSCLWPDRGLEVWLGPSAQNSARVPDPACATAMAIMKGSLPSSMYLAPTCSHKSLVMQHEIVHPQR